MTPGKVRQADVARLAKVSAATVSQVLSPHQGSIRVAPKTAALIRRIASELNYRPDLSAQMLAGKKSGIVGAVLDTLAPGNDHRILTALEKLLAGRGLRLLTAQAHDNPASFRGCIGDFIAYRAEAVVLMSHRYPEEGFNLCEYCGNYRNLVFFRKPESPHEFSYVDVDIGRGLAMMVDHLAATGRRRIAGYFPIESYAAEKRNFIRRAMERNGLEYDDGIFIVPPRHEVTDAELAATARRLAGRGCDALLTNDFFAIRLMHIFKTMGVAVPADIAVTGCDDEPVCQWLDTPLTSINLADDRVARELFRLLEETIEDDAMKPQAVWLEPRIVVRASSAAGH